MTYDATILADSPAIYLKLQDTSGTTATDSSGNARNGTYNGTVTTHYALNQSISLLASDTSAKSVKLMRNGTHTVADGDVFDGTTANGKASVSVPYATYNGIDVAGAAFSTECWFRVPSTLSRYAGVLNMYLASRRAAAPLQHALYLNGAGATVASARYQAYLAGGGSYQPALFSTFATKESALDALVGGTASTGYEQGSDAYVPTGLQGDMFDDTAHHAALSCGAASMRAYLDGVMAINVYTSGVPAIPANTTSPLVFGALNTTGNMYGLIGYLSHCAFYTSELTNAQVAAHYTAGAAKTAFLNMQWQLLAADSMSLSATINTSDSLAFIARVPMVLDANATVSVDMMPVLRAGISLAATVNASTLTGFNRILRVALADAITMSTAMQASKFAQFVFTEVMGIQSAAAVNSVSQMNLSDVITAAIILQAGDAEYVGWVINPNLAASTAAEGLDFISMCRHRGKYYGLKDDGLYRLGGGTDAGADINAFVSLAQSNMGTAQMKRVPYAYIGAASDGRLLLRVIVSGKTCTYAVRNPSTDIIEQRVDLGKGLKGNYWQFEIMNENGEDFEIDKIKFLPVVLERRT